ncbi:MAG: dephospho-CoA kinase [Anaerovoracaceae bacterium]
MKVIGLTGGIGSGKSTVSAYMKEKGCEIIDADLISRQMTEKDSPALDEIREAFGDGFFLGDGSLDRKALGDLVFSDENKRGILQEIVTKKVVKTIDETLRRLKRKAVFPA